MRPPSDSIGRGQPRGTLLGPGPLLSPAASRHAQSEGQGSRAIARTKRSRFFGQLGLGLAVMLKGGYPSLAVVLLIRGRAARAHRHEQAWCRAALRLGALAARLRPERGECVDVVHTPTFPAPAASRHPAREFNHGTRAREGSATSEILRSRVKNRGDEHMVMVILDGAPCRIGPAAWAEVYDDVRRLLVAHPSRLLGYDWTTVAGVGASPLHALATSLARSGPTLTEDAWAWMTREEDPDLLSFLTALAALDAHAGLGTVRRALLESRVLRHYALGALRNEALMAAVEARIQAAGP